LNSATILDNLRQVLEQEALALSSSAYLLDEQYADVVRAMLACEGKVIVTGLGKSGLVGRKIVATLTSTGTPAVFLHAAEALHGDLGIVAAPDLVWAISKSGEQTELQAMLPAVRRIGARVIAMTANRESTLAKSADFVLHLPMDREACPHDLAPTVSSTLSMALGDAIAMAVMRARGFRSEDFALFHPGGKLGRRLLLRVSDVMVPVSKCELLSPDSGFEQLLSALTGYGIGLVMFGSNYQLAGILTDGDVRRLLAREKAGVFSVTAVSAMIRTPFVLQADQRAYDALEAMETHSPPLNVAPVCDVNGRIVGAVRLHDLLQAG
jgi:arabinose-5-phosphate isomerase